MASEEVSVLRTSEDIRKRWEKAKLPKGIVQSCNDPPCCWAMGKGGCGFDMKDTNKWCLLRYII